jgi:hypothetical protein
MKTEAGAIRAYLYCSRTELAELQASPLRSFQELSQLLMSLSELDGSPRH